MDVRGDSYWFDQAAWAEALQLREQVIFFFVFYVFFVILFLLVRQAGHTKPIPR